MTWLCGVLLDQGLACSALISIANKAGFLPDMARTLYQLRSFKTLRYFPMVLKSYGGSKDEFSKPVVELRGGTLFSLVELCWGFQPRLELCEWRSRNYEAL